MSRGIPWVRVFAEGAVIVGSILLAFSLDAWWDRRSEAEALRRQMDAVAREIRSQTEALERAARAHDLNVRLSQHLAALLGPVAEGSSLVVSDTLVGPLLPQVTADVTAGALETFLAAGGLELVRDQGVRRQLLEWPARIEDLQDDETYLRNYAAADLAAYLRANAAVANAELYAGPWLMSRFAGGPEVDSDALGSVALRRDQELINLLAARESGERMIVNSLRRLIEEAGEIVAALEAAESSREGQVSLTSREPGDV